MGMVQSQQALSGTEGGGLNVQIGEGRGGGSGVWTHVYDLGTKCDTNFLAILVVIRGGGEEW